MTAASASVLAPRRINLVQGDHIALDKPGTVVSTLLGSCIAVCLHDHDAHVGGMNHFLLGQPEAGQTVSTNEMQRYGVHAMELLINAMMKKGARRPGLRAHIYGGANIIAGLGSIGDANARFARRFVEMEGIMIGHVDVGGTHARRIEFMPFEGKTRSRLVTDVVPPPRMPTLPARGGEIELF
jgi:chemotaxis protein CheD